MEFPVITNVQKYSIHDGPGIRTTVFFKGCPLHCVWCHNPETQQFGPEITYDAEKCIECRACSQVCPFKGIVPDFKACLHCGKCVDVCMQNARELLARRETPENLAKLLIRDQVFYEESGGGVTLSGGEALAQPAQYLKRLVSLLDRQGITVWVDTCGYTQKERIKELIPYVQGWLYDIKCMDEEKHLRYTGAGLFLILENLKLLAQSGARIWLRLVLVSKLNDSEEDMRKLASFLKAERIFPEKICLLPYHDIGKDKYKRLGMEYGGEDFAPPSAAQLDLLTARLKEEGFSNIQIGG